MRSRLLWSGGALLALLSLVCQWRIGFNNDNAWLLYVAARVLGGARLYVDLVEINPPLVVWLNLPAVWLARATGAGAVDIFRAGLFLAALASSLACERLSRRAFPELPSGGVFFAAVLVLLALPVAWFGQREHLLLVLFLPYLVLSGARLAGHREPSGGIAALAVGAAAGIGLALKPHFLIAWALVLWLGLHSGRPVLRWIENRAIVAVGLVYIAAVLILTPEYVPLVRQLGGVYSAYRTQGLPTILLGRFEPLVVLVALGTYIAYRRGVAPRALADVVALAVAGCLAAVLLQGKGFDYHYYPALALACFLLAVMAVAPSQRPEPRARRGRAIAGSLLVIVAVAYLQADVRIGLGPEHSEMRAYRALERAVGPIRDRSLMVLAPRSGYAFGLVTYGGARWVGRFPCLWLPPVVYPWPPDGQGPPPYRAEREMPAAERWFHDAVVSDALQARPDVILVGVPTPGLGPEDYWFDFLGYFSMDPAFAGMMESYRRSGEAVGYVIYRRNEATAR